jgi:hypothetical protein
MVTYFKKSPISLAKLRGAGELGTWDGERRTEDGEEAS